MINEISEKLVTHLRAFVTTNYPAVADVLLTAPIYIDQEFDPENIESYKTKQKITDYAFVIAGVTCENEIAAPWSHLKLRYSCTIYIVRKLTQVFDITNHQNLVTQGRTATATVGLVTPMHSIATNLAKYTRANKLTDCFWNDIRKVGDYGRCESFQFVPCTFEALRMESRTIS